MIRIIVVAGVLAALVSPRGASAEEQVAQAAEPRWAAGAGLYGGFIGGYAVLGPLDASVGVDNAQVAAERRIGAQTWLGLGLQGGYSRLGNSLWFGGPTSATESQVALALAVRLREVLDPGAQVELAPYGELGVGAIHSHFDIPAQAGALAGTSTIDRGTLNLGGGFTAEHRLTERLFLRLQLQLLDVEYGRTLTSQTALGAAPMLVPSGSTFMAALVARPSLQLFMRF